MKVTKFNKQESQTNEIFKAASLHQFIVFFYFYFGESYLPQESAHYD